MINSNISHLDITRYLPHRNPMLLVDVITDISNNHVVTEYTVSPSCIFLLDEEIQESAIIENMAQTCSAIVGQKYFENDDASINVIGFISAIKKVEIIILPKINQKIVTNANLIARFEADDYNICTMEVVTFLNEKSIATATINLFLQKV